MSVSVGFIGYRNHAERLRLITEKNIHATVGTIFSPRPMISVTGATTCFAELLREDAVVIASPSDTHFAYLEKLSENGYEGYVLCEKPIVTSRRDLHQVKKLNLDFRKMFVNFNYRFSKFVEIVSQATRARTLGEPIHLHVVSTQGLAYLPRYLDSWRSDHLRHPLGITEAKAIHYLDLAIYLFGNPTTVDYQPRLISGKGTAVDTCTLCLSFDKGKTATIFVSYAAPLRHTIELSGSDGYILFDNEAIRHYGPRGTFSTDGRFDKPPVLSDYSYRENGTDFHTESLSTAMDYFLDVCAAGGQFPDWEMNLAYETSEVLLNLTG